MKTKSHWWLKIIGATIAIVGILLLLGGIYLITLGGTWYYLLAGFGLAIAGVRIFQGRLDGVWIYLLVFTGTFFWNFYEVGTRFWASVPRLAAPTVLAFAILLSIPLFKDARLTPKSKRLYQLAGGAMMLGFGVYFFFMLKPHQVIQNDLPITTGQETERTLAMGDEWREYGRTGEGVRYSPLDQINKDNLKNLEVIWKVQHGQIPDNSLANEDQNTPIYADGTLFHCAYNNVVTAFDGTTGKQKWQFNPSASAPLWLRCRSIAYVDPAELPQSPPRLPTLDDGNTQALQQNTDENASNQNSGDQNSGDQNSGDQDAIATIPSDNSDQGVEGIADANARTENANEALTEQTAQDRNNCGPRIVMATVDGRLMAIRADNGKLCLSFGRDGVVDLHEGMGAYPAGQYMPTTGAILAKDKIVIGGWVMDNRALGEAPGVVRAFNALTGELEWAWDSGNPNIDKLPPEGETYTRGTPNVWPPISYDPDLNMVYLPTGNAPPDFWGGERRESDDNFNSSVVAVNLDTGKVQWHFQTTHHDLWDYDLPAQPGLIDFPKADGSTVPALVQLTKRGEIFVLNRETGEPLTKVEEKPVPQGDAIGEYYSPTQPFSVGMPAIGTDDSILDEKHAWGMTPLDHLYCRIRTRQTKWEGHMTPPSEEVYYQFPGNTGGFNWGSASFDQSRNLLLVNDMRWPNRIHLIPQSETGGQDQSGGSEGGPMMGTPYQIFLGYNTLKYLDTPCFEPPYGTVTAIDMATQQIRWQIPMGTTRDIGPFDLKTMIPINTGMPTLGGMLTTKPGITFFNGTQDYYLRAIDTESGEILWKDRLPVGAQSVPITYIGDDGRQFIVVNAGGARHSKDRGDYLIAYALKN